MSHGPLLGGDMDKVSDEWIDANIKALEEIAKSEMRGPYEQLMSLIELRDRRAAEKKDDTTHLTAWWTKEDNMLGP